MPIWVYIYLLIVVLGSVYAVSVNRKKALYYIPGEIISTVAVFTLFLISYDVLSVTYSKTVATISLIYIVYWGLWENRHHYSFFTQSSAEFAKTVEPGENETLEGATFSIKIIRCIGLLFIVLFSLPVIYVYFNLMVGGR